jgi:hypothetical protein
MSSPSRAYQDFLESIKVGGNRATFVYDVSGWSQTSEKEQGEIENILIKRTVESRDVRAIATLAEINSQSAIPYLQALLSDANESVKSETKRAIARLTQDAAAVSSMVEDMQNNSGLNSVKNAYYLKDIPGNAALKGLFEALASPSFLTRLHAKNGIIERLGVDDTLLNNPNTPLCVAICGLLLRFPSVYQQKARWLQRTFAGIGLNKDPSSLGLVYIPGDQSLVQRLENSIKNTNVAYDTDAIEGMNAHDRAWAEMLLLDKLYPRFDQRALDAIVSLKLTGLIPALNDARTIREQSAIPRASEIEPYNKAILALS